MGTRGIRGLAGHSTRLAVVVASSDNAGGRGPASQWVKCSSAGKGGKIWEIRLTQRQQ